MRISDWSSDVCSSDLLRNGAPPPSSSTFTGMETVNISNLSGSAAATTNIALGVNLPSTADVGDSHFVTAQVFDSLGNAHDMDITFTKTAVKEIGRAPVCTHVTNAHIVCAIHLAKNKT